MISLAPPIRIAHFALPCPDVSRPAGKLPFNPLVIMMLSMRSPGRTACAALVLALAAVACGDGSGPEAPTPAITHLNPNPLLQWTENGLNLTVTGSGFEEGAVVRLNGEGQNTAYVSPSQLVAQLPEFLTHEARTFQVSVLNPGTKGKESGTVALPVEHRRPEMHGLAPLQATQGGGPFLLTVYGVNFAQNAVVRWNGADRATRFETQRMLTVQIPASDLVQAGAVQVTVFNPAPGGGESPPMTFDVPVRPNPIPTVTGVSPGTVIVGTDTEITVTGFGFMPESQVSVGGTTPAVTVVSSTELRFVLSANVVNRTGSAFFVVINPPPGGGPSSNARVEVENPAPVLSALSPAQAVVGSQDLVVRLIGTGFTETSTVLVDASYVEVVGRTGSTELQIVLPARDLDEARTMSIEVSNSGPGGGISQARTFTVGNPAPVIQSLSPSEMGASPFFINLRVRVTGTGFIPETVVRVNGDSRPTEYLSATEIDVLLSGGDLDTPGTLILDAVNPSPGGGISGPVAFEVTEPPPLPPPGGP